MFQKIDTSNKWVFLKWCLSDVLFIDCEKVNTGPTPSYEKIKKLLAKKVKNYEPLDLFLYKYLSILEPFLNKIFIYDWFHSLGGL